MHGITDIHNHILPGIDDGAEGREEAADMLMNLSDEGITAVVATPHYHVGSYAANVERRERAYDILTEECSRLKLDIWVYKGNEIYYGSRAMEDLLNKQVWTMGGSNYVLMEFSPYGSYNDIRQGLNYTIREGFRPILAHAERYHELVKQSQYVDELVEMGVYIQLNSRSIMGSSGTKVKSFCKRLLKDDMVHFVASDAHGARSRKCELKGCADYLEKKFGLEYANKIFRDNPNKMILNEYI